MKAPTLLKGLQVQQLVDGFIDGGEEGGVVAYGGKLNLRPRYQRLFVYDDDDISAVIETILYGCPLNSIYFGKNDDGTYEVIDGQQRIISMCLFHEGLKFTNWRGNPTTFWDSLTEKEQKKFLTHDRLQVWVVEGDEPTKLFHFKRINHVGKQLSPQEMRNAVHVSDWVVKARQWFGREEKKNNPAWRLAEDYAKVGPDGHKRQEWLELVLKWRTLHLPGKDLDARICEYMSKCGQQKKNADALWFYFQRVIGWIKKTFPTAKDYTASRSVNWGELYLKHGQRKDINPDIMTARIKELMDSEKVDKKAGIFSFVLDGHIKHLSSRAFDKWIQETQHSKQNQKCAYKKCKQPDKKWKLGEMDAHHEKMHVDGGLSNVVDNCIMLCKECHKEVTRLQMKGKR
ncbi:MAG: DUF262 domain-containing protein [Proteobacteria bacterium]|nr:DUF262 domain-containing protein [Pseudomonadota bacterium]